MLSSKMQGMLSRLHTQMKRIQPFASFCGVVLTKRFSRRALKKVRAAERYVMWN